MCTAGFGLCSRANTPAPELPLHAASGGSSAPPLSLSPAYPRRKSQLAGVDTLDELLQPDDLDPLSLRHESAKPPTEVELPQLRRPTRAAQDQVGIVTFFGVDPLSFPL